MTGNKSQFWTLDCDSDVEIYDSLSWNLPGFRSKKREASGKAPDQKRNRKHG